MKVMVIIIFLLSLNSKLQESFLKSHCKELVSTNSSSFDFAVLVWLVPLTWNLWSCQLLSTIELQNGLHRGTFVKSNLKEISMVLCENRQKVITMFSILHKVIRILELLNVIEHSYQNMWIVCQNHHQLLVQSLMMCIVIFQLIFIHVAQCSLNNDDIVASIKVWQHQLCICNASY